MKQQGKALKTIVAVALTFIMVLSALSLIACNPTKEDEFMMTYELACKLNHEKFGVTEEGSANYGGDRVYGYKYLEDGYIRMHDPENVQEDDPVNFYCIVKNFTITKPDLDVFGNELETSREYNIWGMFQVPLWFRPEWIDNPGGRSFPLAIECHGFNTTSGGFRSAKWANTWTEKGYICYAFDFIGGAPGPNWSNGTLSGPKVLDEARGDKGELVDRTGAPLTEYPEYVSEFPKDKPMWDYYGGGWMEMSVATEVQDLHCVIDAVKELDVVDEEHISLMGQSQGGVVCAVTAAERAKKAEENDEDCDIESLVLIYPALSFITDMHYFFGQNLQKFDTEAPETLDETTYPLLEQTLTNGRTFIMGANVGPRYISQCYNWGIKAQQDDGVIKAGEYTMFHRIKGYNNPVLIVTGSTDTTVDTKWSFATIYGNNSAYGLTQSTLTLVSNCEHAFDMGAGGAPLKQRKMAYAALADYLDLNNLTKPLQK